MISLYKHNEDGYDKLDDMLKESKFATVNHATGTGKSFIILKYLYNHRDKKYLFIAPTYQILKQFIMRDIKAAGIDPDDLSIDVMIYRNLLSADTSELYEKYDGFVLDEYHRAGAKKTYKKIIELKELIKNGTADKKIIGLTATPIRYLDDGRNMTEEIFDGNMASNISLAEAIAEGILPVPQYFIRNLQVEEEYKKTIKKINKLYKSSIKDSFVKQLESIKEVTNYEDNITELFSENIKENGKYILFSSTIGRLKEAMRKSYNWFNKFKNLKLYEVHSYMKSGEIDEQIKAFDDAESGLNIMFAVDLFSEGIHPKKVDGVILNRSTTSPIIYFQQLGRTLTSSNLNDTVQVFDLKGNYVSHEAIRQLYDDIKKLANEKIKENPMEKQKYQNILDAFKIVDTYSKYITYLRNLRQKVTYEVIISSRIEYIITSLEQYIILNNLSGKSISGVDILDENLQKLYYELFKYRDYIDDDSREKLENLSITMPTAGSITKEEKAKNKIDYFIDLLEQYIQSNNLHGEIITEYNLKDEFLKRMYHQILNYSKYITIYQMMKLKELNVLLPKQFSVSIDERKKILNGYESEYQMEKAKYDSKKEDLFHYLSEYGIPSDGEMLDIYLNILIDSDKYTRDEILKLVDKEHLPTWNKILLNIDVSKDDIYEFYNMCERLYNEEGKILPCYEKALNKVKRYYPFVLKLLELIKKDKLEEKRLKMESDNKIVIELLKYIDSFDFNNNIFEDEIFQSMYLNLSSENKRKIKNHINGIIQKTNNELISNLVPNQPMNDYVKLLKSCDLDNLYMLKRELEKQKEKVLTLNNYVDSNIKNEKFDDIDGLLEQFDNLITEEGISFLVSNDTRNFKLSISKILDDLKIKIGLCDYVIFCLTSKRRPVSKMEEEEVELFELYNYIRKEISNKNFSLINDYLNTEEIMRGTQKQIVINATADKSLKLR